MYIVVSKMHCITLLLPFCQFDSHLNRPISRSLFAYTPLIFHLVLPEKHIRILLRWTFRVRIIEQILDAEKNLYIKTNVLAI